MKLLIDMNLSPQWVEAFRSAEFYAEHWPTIGSRSASDAEIMAFAHQHNCVVVTNDLDFSVLTRKFLSSYPAIPAFQRH